MPVKEAEGYLDAWVDLITPDTGEDIWLEVEKAGDN